jgi:hypothetical protein
MWLRRTQPLFVKDFLNCMRPLVASAGECVARDHDLGLCLYVLQEGTCRRFLEVTPLCDPSDNREADVDQQETPSSGRFGDVDSDDSTRALPFGPSARAVHVTVAGPGTIGFTVAQQGGEGGEKSEGQSTLCAPLFRVCSLQVRLASQGTTFADRLTCLSFSSVAQVVC